MHRSSLPENHPNLFARVARMLGLPPIRGHVPLVIALCVNAIGAGLSGPLILLYLTSIAGVPVATAGIVLTASGLASLAVPALSAALASSIGARGIVTIGQSLQAIGLTGLLLAALPVGRALPVLVTFCLLLSVGQRAFWSSIFALVADAADTTSDTSTAHERSAGGDRAGRDSWFALSGMAQGVGFTTGALLAGGLLIVPGPLPYVIALAVSALTFSVSGMLLARTENRRSVASSSTRIGIHRDGSYLLFIATNTLFAFCSIVLGIGLPLYIVQGLGVSAWLIGPLLALNTVLGATCQGLAVRLTARFSRVRMLVVAGLIWAGWGIAMAALDIAPMWAVVPGLFLCVMSYSIAELIHAPLSMGLASDAAPAAARTGYLSWFQYSFALAGVIAPGVFALAFAVTPSLPWVCTSILALLGCLGMTVLARRLDARIRD